jgi:iron complex outermembrane receptor protein
MRLKKILCLSACAIPVSTFAHAMDDVKRDEIVVTASPLEKSEDETILGVSVLDGEELQNRLENSIGETLRREPGISSTFFGPGASRPVIRGLGGDRISVLDSGIGSIDASATSPDHAVSVEPAMAERIEIVRGASMLLYGSSAAGGVVNVFSGRIPRDLPEGGVDGALRVGGSTVDDGVEAAGGFDVDLGKSGAGNFVFHGEGFYRSADDYDIPGFAESEALRASEPPPLPGEEKEEVFGTAENTSLRTRGGAAGISYVVGNGFIGLSANALNTNYGVPGAHDHEDGGAGGEEEGGVTIGLKQRRIDFDSAIETDFLFFRKASLRVGYADYEHREIDPSGETGTTFTNEGVEGRLELLEKPWSFAGGEIDGAIGVQWKLRDFAAIGEEAFTPPSTTRQIGLFALKEYSIGAFRFDVGGRYEATRHEAEDLSIARDFDSVSVSAGFGFELSDNVFFGVNGFRTERAPSTEELFSNGPHLATNSFEIGDATLDLEIGRGVEATAKFSTNRVAIAINGFYTSYRDFIYEAATGSVQDDLPVFAYVAADAAFRGFEAEAEAELFVAAGFDFHADAALDYVRATVDVSGDQDLPRIPPFSGLFGIEANSKAFDIRLEADYAAAQRKVAQIELPTDDYFLLNAFLTWRPIAGKGLAFRFAALNLSDAEARIHSSFIKDLAPLTGRSFRVSVAGTF